FRLRFWLAAANSPRARPKKDARNLHFNPPDVWRTILQMSGLLTSILHFIGIPRMNPELAWLVAIFCIGRKPRCEVSMASASQTVRTALEGLIWRFFLT